MVRAGAAAAGARPSGLSSGEQVSHQTPAQRGLPFMGLTLKPAQIMSHPITSQGRSCHTVRVCTPVSYHAIYLLPIAPGSESDLPAS